MKAQQIGDFVARSLEEVIENDPIEAFLAFAGLFATTGVHIGVDQEDAMHLISNVYKDTLAMLREKGH